jgi:NAD(P)H-dependent FMN reductase
VQVLVVNASPRKRGVTSALLDEFVAAIPAHEVERFRLYDHEVKPCTGCLRCRPDAACVLARDGAHELAEAVTRADVIVIGSPVYWGNVPGPLKNFFDRSVTLFEDTRDEGGWHTAPPRLKGKRAVLIVSGIAPFPANRLGSQGGGAVRALKTVLRAGGVTIGGVLNVAGSDRFDERRDAHLSRVRRLAARL